jgi:hypothetical protein
MPVVYSLSAAARVLTNKGSHVVGIVHFASKPRPHLCHCLGTTNVLLECSSPITCVHLSIDSQYIPRL